MNNSTQNQNTTIEQFLRQVEQRAFVMARIATGDREEALDIVQDAMIKLVDKYPNKPSHEWPPLFYRILQSRLNDWHRKQKVRNRWRIFFGTKPGQERDKQSSGDLENHSTGDIQQPDKTFANQQFASRLEDALAKLPMRQKQAFMLRAWESYSVRETSRIMKCSEGSVKTHYARAREALQKILRDEKHDFKN